MLPTQHICDEPESAFINSKSTIEILYLSNEEEIFHKHVNTSIHRYRRALEKEEEKENEVHFI